MPVNISPEHSKLLESIDILINKAISKTNNVRSHAARSMRFFFVAMGVFDRKCWKAWKRNPTAPMIPTKTTAISNTVEILDIFASLPLHLKTVPRQHFKRSQKVIRHLGEIPSEAYVYSRSDRQNCTSSAYT